MASSIRITMRSPLTLGDLVAELTMDGGQKLLILLEEGRFQGDVPAPVKRLRLTGHGKSEAEVTGSEKPAEPAAYTPAAIEELFETGIAMPGDGQLALSLIWGVHCHRKVSVASSTAVAGDPTAGATRSVRFGSFEHITCAEFVGKDDFGRALPFTDPATRFNKDLPLPVGQKKLRFGEILALAGDYYAHLDALAALDFDWAWPAASDLTALVASDYRQRTLVDETGEVTSAILNAVLEKKDAGGQAALDSTANMARLGVATEYPLRRYLALASQNHCHFGAQPATGKIDDTTNEALRLYRAYHGRALREAEIARSRHDVAGFLQALVVDAFGCHFLSDLFATGHLRVPRRVLSERYGVVRGALGMAHDMHCEDNNSGLWLTPRYASHPRMVWRGYGDDMLHKPEAGFHFLLVRRAVARSAAEVFARYSGATVAEGMRAEDLIPVALAAGAAPQRGDVLPDGKPVTSTDSNTYPLYWWLPDRKVMARRVSLPTQGVYIDNDHPHDDQFLLP